MTAMNWGETKGEAQSNKVTFMKMAAGTNRIRVVGNIVRKYDYWIKNSKGNSLPFENLDFDRDAEAFVQGNRNPVKELGLQNMDWKGNPEFDKEGNPVPLKSKKAYVCPVINRATGKLEYMELKKGVFDGINMLMAKLNDPKIRKRFADPEYATPNPMAIDVIFTKSGEGLSTKYEVDLIGCLDLVQDEDEYADLMTKFKGDAEILKDMKSPEEVFPRRTYDEQKALLIKHLNPEDDAPQGGQDSGEQKSGGDGNWGIDNQAGREALNELED